MRVLLITPDYPPSIGGIQTLLHRLVAHWPAEDDVRVLSLHGYDRRRADLSGSSVRGSGLGHRAAVVLLNVRALLMLIWFRPHVVVSGHIVASPAAIAMNLLGGTRYLQYVHARELAHHRRLAAVAIRRAAGVIAVSEYTRALIDELGTASRVDVISPGVDRSPDVLPAIKRGPRTVIVVARLDDTYKGHDVLIRAFPLVRAVVADARLVVVGDGPLRSLYEELARAIGVADAVTFAGSCSTSERDELLDQASVFAMPSRIPHSSPGEGFGIVYLEAGMHFLPVIAGNAGGAVDAVQDGVTGVLVDATDHIAVARAITSLLLDQDLAARLGTTGRSRAEAHTWGRMAEAVASMAREVAARRR